MHGITLLRAAVSSLGMGSDQAELLRYAAFTQQWQSRGAGACQSIIHQHWDISVATDGYLQLLQHAQNLKRNNTRDSFISLSINTTLLDDSISC
jgi:hypothetical protein